MPMKAKYFIKNYGLDYSKDVLKIAPESANYVEWYPSRSRFYISDIGCNRAVLLSELKHLVESHELVESCGGVDKVNQYLKDGNVFRFEEKPLMKQAIADVESCQ